jgi:hypothetical protein
LKRVRHHDSIEQGERQRQSEVGNLISNVGLRESFTHRPGVRAQRARVSIDGVYLASGTYQLRQG